MGSASPWCSLVYLCIRTEPGLTPRALAPSSPGHEQLPQMEMALGWLRGTGWPQKWVALGSSAFSRCSCPV